MNLEDINKIKNSICPFCGSAIASVKEEYKFRIKDIKCNSCNVCFYFYRQTYNYYIQISLNGNKYNIYWYYFDNKIGISTLDFGSKTILLDLSSNITPQNIKEKLPTLLNFM